MVQPAETLQRSIDCRAWGGKVGAVAQHGFVVIPVSVGQGQERGVKGDGAERRRDRHAVFPLIAGLVIGMRRARTEARIVETDTPARLFLMDEQRGPFLEKAPALP